MPRIYIGDDDLTFYEVTPAQVKSWEQGFELTQEELSTLKDLRRVMEIAKTKIKEELVKIMDRDTL